MVTVCPAARWVTFMCERMVSLVNVYWLVTRVVPSESRMVTFFWTVMETATMLAMVTCSGSGDGRKGAPSGSTAAAAPAARLGCPDQTAVPTARRRAAVTATDRCALIPPPPSGGAGV